VRDSAQPTFSPSLVHVPGAWLAADQNEWMGALGSADTAHAPITNVKAKKRVIINEHAIMLAGNHFWRFPAKNVSFEDKNSAYMG